jgi:hypothetical protein
MIAARIVANAVAVIQEVVTPYFFRARNWMRPTVIPTIKPPPTDLPKLLAPPNAILAIAPPSGKARSVGIQRIISSVIFMGNSKGPFGSSKASPAYRATLLIMPFI